MTYRDDRDADRARIEALEAELAGANKRIAELEGRSSQALVVAEGGALALATRPSASTTWLGAPIEMELERDFGGAYPADKFEDLIEPCRSITRDTGRTEILKSSMTWSSSTGPKALGPFLVVTVTVRDGGTKLRVGDRLGQLVGAVYGGVGGGVGGSTVIVPIALANTFLAPFMIPVLLAGWLGATYWGCRAIYKRSARKRATQMQRLFDTLSDEIATTIAKHKP